MINIVKKLAEVYDWVVGPATTEKMRTARALAEFNKDRLPEFLDM